MYFCVIVEPSFFHGGEKMEQKNKALKAVFEAMFQFVGVIVEIPVPGGHMCFIDACRDHTMPHGYLYPGMTDLKNFVHLLEQMLKGDGKCVVEVIRPDGVKYRVYWGISKFGEFSWDNLETEETKETKKHQAIERRGALVALILKQMEVLTINNEDIHHKGKLDRTFVTRVIAGDFPRARAGRRYAGEDSRYEALALALQLDPEKFVPLVEEYQRTIFPN